MKMCQLHQIPLALVVFGATSAAALTAPFGTRVNPITDTTFEAIAPTAGTATQYWCGAATYARRAMKAEWDAKIFVLRGRGPSETTDRLSAVQFSMEPVANARRVSGGAVNSFEPGMYLTVVQANVYCDRSVSGR
jgi:hypothetical protein